MHPSLTDLYKEQSFGVILRKQDGTEIHTEMPSSLIERILDPSGAPFFIEIPCNISGTKRLLSTVSIAEIDVRS